MASDWRMLCSLSSDWPESVIPQPKGELEGGRNLKLKFQIYVNQSNILSMYKTDKGSEVIQSTAVLPVLSGRLQENWFYAYIKVPYLLSLSARFLPSSNSPCCDRVVLPISTKCLTPGPGKDWAPGAPCREI